MNKLVLKSKIFKECISEFLATLILVFLSNCVNATLTFTRAGNVSLVAAPLGSGFALLVALSISGGASGCHANPAVTLAFAIIRKIKWNRVLPYFLAQYLGAFMASVLVYSVYYDSINLYDGGVRQIPPNVNATAQIFATYPLPHVSLWAALLDQIVATGILLIAVEAIVDPRNLAINKELYPLFIGFVLSAILFALPYNCMAPLNPARDLSPRIFTLLAGYGTEVFSHRGYGYFMIPIIGPHIGAIFGVWIYKLAIEMHWPDEIIYIKERTEFGSDDKLILEDDSDTIDERPSVSAAPLIHVDL